MNRFSKLLFLIAIINVSQFPSNLLAAKEIHIQINPTKPLFDESIQIEISGLELHQQYQVKLSATDKNDQQFISSAKYLSDGHGYIKLEKHAALSGSYNGVDAMGLFWSMDIEGENRGRLSFNVPDSGVSTFTISVLNKKLVLAKKSFTRHQQSEDIKETLINEDGIYGYLYSPSKAGKWPAIIVLGGSEGGVNSAKMQAKLLASKGAVTLALGYFSFEQEGGLPNTLEEIPLEYFAKARIWLAKHSTVDPMRISIMGGSKGAEAALLSAIHFKGFHSVIAIGLSSVSWASPFAEGDRASWTFKGKPLPFVNYRRDPNFPRPVSGPDILAHHYAYSLDQPYSKEAVIAIEKLTVNALLIAGEQDLIWPSARMGRQLINRAKKYRLPSSRVQLATFANAGHSFNAAQLPTTWTPGMYRRWPNGGNPEGNAKAQGLAWKLIVDFLELKKSNLN